MLTGGGPVNRALGGVAVATPVDAIGAVNWNPATLSAFERSTLAFGVEALFANNQFASTVDAGAYGPGVPATRQSGRDRSESGAVPVPNIAWVHRPQEGPYTVGLGVLTLGGFGLNYGGNESNPLLSARPPVGLGVGPVFTEYAVLQIVPTVSRRITDRLSIGVAPIINMATLTVAPALIAAPDDAQPTVKAASIKFSDNPVDNPFDIEMNTGRSLFWSVANFFDFVRNQHEHGGIQYVSYSRKCPAGRDAGQESIALNPSSYARLDYRSQCPFLFKAKDAKRRYVNFRLIPADRAVEPCVNDAAHLGVFFGDQRIRPGETRNRNVLKHEYAKRLAAGPIEYVLQLQLHEATDGDSELLFCSNKVWDEATHPWMDLARVTIDRLLSYEESLWMYFSLNHQPSSVGLIEATSIHDYNSLNYIRAKADLAKKARLFAYRLFGMPKALPDDGPRNVTELTCEWIR